MSVIIRLQNLPWSANALDIRQFFKGLSIPDGGVHIVGGEMGDAFIAFSTDEDARQAMMHDRKKINEVQVRLLLSSRAEMQKVIETARQQSLQALKNAGAVPAIKATVVPSTLSNPQPPVITQNSLHNILSSAAPSFLAYQKQAGITLVETPNEPNINESVSTHRSSVEKTRDRRRSTSRDRRRSRSRDRIERNDRNGSRRGRRDRSRSRSRDRDWKSRRSSRRSRSPDRGHDRNRDRSPDRSRNSSRSNMNSRERESGNTQSNKSSTDLLGTKSLSKILDTNESASAKLGSISPWGIPGINSYQTNSSDNIGGTSTNSSTPFSIAGSNTSNILNPFSVGTAIPGLRGSQLANSYTSSVGNKSPDSQSNTSAVNIPAGSVMPPFQSYSSSVATPNNYSIHLFNSNSNSSDSPKTFALQNPYTTAIQQATLNTNSTDSASAEKRSPTQQNTSTMFPGLSLIDKKPDVPLTQGNPTATSTSNFSSVSQLSQEPIAFANTNPYAQMYPNLFAQAAAASVAKPSNISQKSTEPETQRSKEPVKGSCCIKVSDMCASTTYSDVRKFFMGLFIPHNGIKMVNDKHGLRIGVAYIKFSRVSSVHKALMRNNSTLKSKAVKVEMVTDEEFDEVEDSYRPQGRFDRNNDRGDRNYSDNRGDYDRNDDDNDDTNTRGDRVPNSDMELKSEPFTVLYIEDIPSSAVEHDLMRMFSSYTIFDILLTPSRENRREFKGHVLFSRAEEAKAALEDKSRHMIGYRKVRVRPATVDEMEREKEKLRLANEQLMKEEEALAEAERLKEEQNQAEDDMDVADDTSSLACTDVNNDMQLNEKTERNSSTDSKNTNIPSLFDIDSMRGDDNMSRGGNTPSDPRLRRQKPSRFEPLKPTDEMNLNMNIGNNMGMSSNMSQSSNMSMSSNRGMSSNMDMNSNRGMSSNMDMNSNRGMSSSMDMSSNMGMSNNMDMSSNMGMNNNMGMHNNNMGMNMNNGGNFMAPMMNNNNRNMNSNNMMNNSNGMNNFIIMKNCDYNTRMNDIADLLQGAFLRLKHIEPLRGERNMPTGEFIVEFQDSRDAETALHQFNNTTFRQRKLRIRPIMPQEIADKIGKPFMNCYPGGGGSGGGPDGRPFDRNPFQGNNNDGPPIMNMGGGSGGRYGNNNMNNDNNNGRGGMGGNSNGGGSMMNRGGRGDRGHNGGYRSDHSSGGMRNRGGRSNNSASSHDGHNSDQDDEIQIIDDSSNDVVISGGSGPNRGDGDSSGIPEKFTRPGCVIAMENVPYKAELIDILKFFGGYDLTPDDIIRRFNDDGTPTGDARVAFETPSMARSAYNSRRRKQIFNRTIRLSLL
ncbi:putative uncharacterized protein DDB_G0282133 [Bactrocera dorsalis]|uniref:RRM domain-containing protein n=1 Tax=Bactrocera dorsalis TaxID=27457 RepID=A0A6I9VN38_BACDO|nr:putative uncharacterized protein DDB_G0282133 [Bactrocera dorsalis]XP_049314641.1 putative uncharacterized protein DDB_G0282133 [Bactrocera dorsalis]